TRPTSAVGLFCSATDFKSFKTGRFRHPAVNADTACRLMHVVAKTDTLFVDDDILSDHLPYPFFLKRDRPFNGGRKPITSIFTTESGSLHFSLFKMSGFL